MSVFMNLKCEETGPDAELLRLSAEFDDFERRFLAICQSVEDDDDAEALAKPIKQLQCAILDRLAELRATSPEGHAARVRTLLLENRELKPEELVASPYWNERLLGMLLRDLAEHVGARRPT